ncbi:MAG: hypothetical protein AAGF89_07440 [Bacteroidota bacterium]
MRLFLSYLLYGGLLLLTTRCTYDQVVVVATCDNDLVLEVLERIPSSCGIASGSVLMGVSGGSAAAGAISFRIEGLGTQTNPAFTNLAAGAYTLIVEQGACTASLDFTIENAAGLNATAVALPSDCGNASGRIELTTSDGVGSVQFSLEGGPVQTEAVFENLSPGEYQLTATDEIGCEVTLQAKVLSNVAFAEVETIVTTSCAISGCHAGNVSPDFRVRENILGRANRIRARTGNASMPPPSSGGSLTEQQINAIACWVADGAPE